MLIVACVLRLIVIQLSTLEGRGDQDEERLAQRTHWYADPQIKFICSLTRLNDEILAVSQYCTANLLPPFKFLPKAELGNGSSTSRMHWLVIFLFPAHSGKFLNPNVGYQHW